MSIKQLIKDKLPFTLPVMRVGANMIRHSISKRRIQHLLRTRTELFVEVGAGDKQGAGNWVTVDMTPTCDIFWDLRKGLPFPNNRIAKIYSSHFFEHLSFQETQGFLDECRRVLTPGGTFSICVPNARLYLEAYLNSELLDADRFYGYRPAYNQTTRIDSVNYIAYMDGHHKYMFDEENLVRILEAKGFKNVHLRAFDAELDRPERDAESIYAEAEK
jgi:predicted SAM-dependent methyltransferase